MGEAGEKVSLESTHFYAESWKHTVFGCTLWWLLEDRHKPECTSSVMKQKVISGDMCRGGDIRDMPVAQKKQGERSTVGRGHCTPELPEDNIHRDISWTVTSLWG